jgi:hypothetical protein
VESESVGSSDEEVACSLLRFPVVNLKRVVLRSYRYPVASRYQHEEEVKEKLISGNNTEKTTTITTFYRSIVVGGQ